MKKNFLFTDNKSYILYANFEDIGNLKTSAAIKISGVIIGSVKNIKLKTDTYTAEIEMEILHQFNNLPYNSTASIMTSGLLGEQYIDIDPGFIEDEEDTFLQHKDTIEDTNSALILENLIGQLIYNIKG